MDRTSALGTAVGVIRAGVGASLVVAPKWAGRIWVGAGADGAGSAVFARAVGARDVVLGASTLAAVGSGRDTTQMLRLGAMADFADAAATMIAAPNMDPRRRVAMPLIAAGVGAACLVAAQWAARADGERGDTTTLSDEVRARVGTREDVDVRAVDQARV
jgi:hypothetical protein